MAVPCAGGSNGPMKVAVREHGSRGGVGREAPH